MRDMGIRLDGVTLPKPKTFYRTDKPSEQNRVTLGGEMKTYFVAQRREWSIGWHLLKDQDYQTIMSIYNNQYVNRAYPRFEFPTYGIDTFAKIEISTQNIKYNGSLIDGFAIAILEKFPLVS